MQKAIRGTSLNKSMVIFFSDNGKGASTNKISMSIDSLFIGLKKTYKILSLGFFEKHPLCG